MAEATAGSGPGLGRAACIVTGASRGFGRSAARLLAARLAPGSALLLVARSAGALAQLEEQLRAAHPALRVLALPADLADDGGPERVARAAAALRPDGPLQRLLLLNNAGERPAATDSTRPSHPSPPLPGGLGIPGQRAEEERGGEPLGRAGQPAHLQGTGRPGGLPSRTPNPCPPRPGPRPGGGDVAGLPASLAGGPRGGGVPSTPLAAPFPEGRPGPAPLPRPAGASLPAGPPSCLRCKARCGAGGRNS